MTDKEIVEKIVAKAIKNGYRFEYDKDVDGFSSGDYVGFYIENNLDIAIKTTASVKWQAYNYRTIIFSHEFAKALWGEKPVWLYRSMLEDFVPEDVVLAMPEPAIERYLWHLQQMVLEKKPTVYLEKFL